MANALFDKGRESFLKGEIAWQTKTIDVILVKVGTEADEYNVDLANHQFLQDVTAGARVALLSGNAVEDTELTTKTTAAGVAGADDAVFEEVTGDEIGAIVIYARESTDTETTSRLIAYIDDATGLPVTPNGGDITIEWDDGANKIFKL